MALLRVRWFQTEQFVSEIEVDGYDPEATEVDDEDGPIMSQLIEMDNDALSKDFDGCTEREVTGVEVVREGDEPIEIAVAAPKHEEMF